MSEVATEELLYPKDVLDVLNLLQKEKTFQRPRGKNRPKFKIDEVSMIARLIFTKPQNVTIKLYQRVPRKRQIPLKRRAFLEHLMGEAGFNAAKAARMAGYSSRSAKQIAYKLLHP